MNAKPQKTLIIQCIETIIHRFTPHADQKIELKYEAHVILYCISRLPGWRISWCDFKSWMMLNSLHPILQPELAETSLSRTFCSPLLLHMKTQMIECVDFDVFSPDVRFSHLCCSGVSCKRGFTRVIVVANWAARGRVCLLSCRFSRACSRERKSSVCVCWNLSFFNMSSSDLYRRRGWCADRLYQHMEMLFQS